MFVHLEGREREGCLPHPHPHLHPRYCATTRLSTRVLLPPPTHAGRWRPPYVRWKEKRKKCRQSSIDVRHVSRDTCVASFRCTVVRRAAVHREAARLLTLEIVPTAAAQQRRLLFACHAAPSTHPSIHPPIHPRANYRPDSADVSSLTHTTSLKKRWRRRWW